MHVCARIDVTFIPIYIFLSQCVGGSTTQIVKSQHAPYTPIINGYVIQSKTYIPISNLKMVITLFQVYCTTKCVIDGDSCSNIVVYFYDVAHGRIYKNWQGKLAQLLIYSPGY